MCTAQMLCMPELPHYIKAQLHVHVHIAFCKVVSQRVVIQLHSAVFSSYLRVYLAILSEIIDSCSHGALNCRSMLLLLKGKHGRSESAPSAIEEACSALLLAANVPHAVAQTPQV